jgi:hypothetical protein
MKTTTTKYFEATYAEKRLWVSRLLTQFHHDGAVIVSVDESNFKSELDKDWCWQFNHDRVNQVVNGITL